MNIRRPAIAGVVLAVSIAGAAAAPASALTLNHSILLYKPGHAETGTLKNGAYVRKRVLSLGTVTHAAASRDTLALYNAATGRLRTGQFRQGVYTPIRSITIRKGFSHVIASCDSILFYDRDTGRTMTAVLTGGTLGSERHTFFLSTVWRKLIASCDTTWFQGVAPPEDPSSSGTKLQGELDGGVWTQGFYAPDTVQDLRIAATSDSFIALYDGPSCAPWCGTWGQMGNGGLDPDGSATSFGMWQRVTGAATTLLFYNANGLEARSTLVGGQYSFIGSSTGFPKNLTIIAAGR
jgi:hypothetical protein